MDYAYPIGPQHVPENVTAPSATYKTTCLACHARARHVCRSLF